MFQSRNNAPSPTLMLSTLAVAAMACSLVSLPFGGGDEEPTSPPAPSEPTAAPTTAPSEPQAPADATGGGTLPVGEGACANNLMPLEKGNQWTYVQLTGPGTDQVGAGEPTPVPEFTFTWTVVDVAASSATIEMAADELGIFASYTVECDDGAILTFPTFSLSLSLPGGGGGVADMSYEHASGVFLPSTQTLEENNWDYSWQTEVMLSGQITSTPVEGQTFEMTFEETPWSMTWSTVGAGDSAFEPVEVRAGAFERALAINQQSDLAFNMQMQGTGIQTQFTNEATQWYVPGIGLVKTRTERSSMDLGGISMPLSEQEAESTLELADFRQGVDPSDN